MKKKVAVQGDIGCIYEDGTVEKGYSGQGMVFKSNEAFETGKGICYIPELCGNIIDDMYKGEIKNSSDIATFYTRQMFLDEVNGNEHLASVIFDMVDWQSPSTLVDELVTNDEEFSQEFDEWNNKQFGTK